MLLELVINDGSAIRGSLNSKGFLSAHLNVSIGRDEGDAATVRLSAIDTSLEPNSVYTTWETGKLAIGDKVEIRLLPTGEPTSPTEVRQTSESPKNLFSDAKQAELLLVAISVCDKELMGVIERARAAEPKEEFEKIALAVAGIISELDSRLISPTLRRHPELLDEAKQLKLV